MTTPAIGFRVVSSIERPTPDRYRKLADATTANVTDAMNRLGTLHHSIKPIVAPDRPVVGPAVTVKTRSGDNLMISKALTLCRPGDVLVVSAGGSDDLALWGGVLSSLALKKGVAALVTDGFVRDTAEMRRVGLPVWAAGVVSAAPTADGKGEVNTPISCAGVAIQPGDVIVADEDGAVAVPEADLDAVVQRTAEVMQRDDGWMREIDQRGGFAGTDSIDERLREKGCVFEE